MQTVGFKAGKKCVMGLLGQSKQWTALVCFERGAPLLRTRLETAAVQQSRGHVEPGWTLRLED